MKKINISKLTLIQFNYNYVLHLHIRYIIDRNITTLISSIIQVSYCLSYNVIKIIISAVDVLGVAQWRWVANDDTCGICRVAFEACCPDCKFAGDDCPLGILINYNNNFTIQNCT